MAACRLGCLASFIGNGYFILRYSSFTIAWKCSGCRRLGLLLKQAGNESIGGGNRKCHKRSYTGQILRTLLIQFSHNYLSAEKLPTLGKNILNSKSAVNSLSMMEGTRVC